MDEEEIKIASLWKRGHVCNSYDYIGLEQNGQVFCV